MNLQLLSHAEAISSNEDKSASLPTIKSISFREKWGAGGAKWQEPCYYFSELQELPPTYTLYDRLIVKSPDMPSGYPGYSTPPLSATWTPPPPILRPSSPPTRGRYRYRFGIPGSSMYRDVPPGIRTRSSGQRIRLNYNMPNGPMV